MSTAGLSAVYHHPNKPVFCRHICISVIHIHTNHLEIRQSSLVTFNPRIWILHYYLSFYFWKTRNSVWLHVDFSREFKIVIIFGGAFSIVIIFEAHQLNRQNRREFLKAHSLHRVHLNKNNKFSSSWNHKYLSLFSVTPRIKNDVMISQEIGIGVWQKSTKMTQDQNVLTFLLHFSQVYAFSPSKRSPLT